MTATTTAQPISTRTSAPATRGADSATELLLAMAALPTGHPHRANLRDKAIEAWLPLANHLAHRYSGRGEPSDDLTQTAAIGLIKAIDKYDPDPRRRLRRLRHPHHHRRNQTTLPRPHLGHPRPPPPPRTPPRHHRSQQHPPPNPRPLPHRHRHRHPPPHHRRRRPRRPRRRPRLQRRLPVHPHRRRRTAPPNSATLLGGEDTEFELAELRVALGPALATLDEREQKILTLRFYGNLTQSQIADHIGVSQMHVCRLLARALTKLRGQLADTY